MFITRTSVDSGDCRIDNTLQQDSRGGNTRTVMVANVGPADYNYDETLSTLRCCSVLQCVVMCCSVLQCVAACCSVLQ